MIDMEQRNYIAMCLLQTLIAKASPGDDLAEFIPIAITLADKLLVAFSDEADTFGETVADALQP